MTFQNRATPTGDVAAEAGRSLVFGNRGCLHAGTFVLHEGSPHLAADSVVTEPASGGLGDGWC